MPTIKNWRKFQHYQTGKHAEKKPEWIKLYRGLLDDIEWHELEPTAAKTLVSLWLLASEYGGTLPDLKTIAFRLRMPEKQIKSVLSKLPNWLDESLDNGYTASSLEKEIEEEKEIEREPAKRSSQISEGWEPTNELTASLEAQGFQKEFICSEVPKFRDHHRAKGSLFRDHDAAFRNWMRRAKEWSAAKPDSGGAARKNGTGWYIKRDSAEYEAWWRHSQKISDYKLQGKLQFGGDEINVPSRWPTR
jgi:hypothetical protein